MFFKRLRKKEEQTQAMEREIQEIRQETLHHAEVAARSTDKLIKLLNDDKLGVTGRIFYATGGARRIQK